MEQLYKGGLFIYLFITKLKLHTLCESLYRFKILFMAGGQLWVFSNQPHTQTETKHQMTDGAVDTNCKCLATVSKTLQAKIFAWHTCMRQRIWHAVNLKAQNNQSGTVAKCSLWQRDLWVVGSENVSLERVAMEQALKGRGIERCAHKHTLMHGYRKRFSITQAHRCNFHIHINVNAIYVLGRKCSV